MFFYLLLFSSGLKPCFSESCQEKQTLSKRLPDNHPNVIINMLVKLCTSYCMKYVREAGLFSISAETLVSKHFKHEISYESNFSYFSGDVLSQLVGLIMERSLSSWTTVTTTSCRSEVYRYHLKCFTSSDDLVCDWYF